MIFQLSRSIESLANLEHVVFVKQVKGLFVIQKGRQQLFWPWSDSSIFTKVLKKQSQLFFNNLS